MLIAPIDDQENLLIVGIDPGTDTLGACIAEIELSGSFKMKVIDTITINGTEHLKHNRGYMELSKIHGNKYARLKAIENALDKWFSKHKPHLVCSESPFMYHSPHAFASLTEALTIIRISLSKYNDSMFLFLVPPQMAKAAIGSLSDKKLGVRPAIEELLSDGVKYGLEISSYLDIDKMSEHELDAIAVAYTRYIHLGIFEGEKDV